MEIGGDADDGAPVSRCPRCGRPQAEAGKTMSATERLDERVIERSALGPGDAHSGPPGPVRRRTGGGPEVLLLDADPQLGAHLSASERRQARHVLRVGVLEVGRGRWSPPPAAVPASDYGFLVLDGLLARRVRVGRAVAIDLLGPGDIVRPREEPLVLGREPVYPEWEIFDAARLAVLDERVTAVIGRRPALAVAFSERLLFRARCLSYLRAVSHLPRVEERVLATLWYLADRWGERDGDGMSVSLPLTHRILGEMVGARRSSVTLALGHLHEQRLVTRARGGAFLLRGEPPRLGDPDSPIAVARR
jgi:CRP/FNR family transcriptional regulator, cyclic AMP receptor protein